MAENEITESIDTSVKNTSITQNQSDEEAKAQALLEEKDSESRLRTYSGPAGRAITVLLCVWPAICGALQTQIFEQDANVKRIRITGPGNGANCIITFDIL